MARIAGVELPPDKRILYGLQGIYGVGSAQAKRVLKETGVDENVRGKALTEDQINRLNAYLDKNVTVEGALRRQIMQNIARLKEIGSYRGLRHRRGLPVRGQRTRTNSRTRKGPRKTVAGKKQAATKT
ncbi:MAG: 30S ribosomal protein S13 [Planctomycetes bacterium]|nr:30S ribosomal protein S13 [Planctomycetota bacterium]